MKTPSHIIRKLEVFREEGRFRQLMEEQNLIDFSSNDYLGIAREGKRFKEEPIRTGSGGSRLLAGNYKVHEDLEQFCADFFGSEAALLFNSGFEANLAVLSTIPSRHDVVFYDELCHASIRDGLRLSGARSYNYTHGDLGALEDKMQRLEGRQKYIVTETVFSMDGDSPDLEELLELAHRNDALVILDEAHATGLYGPGGRGKTAEAGLTGEVFLRLHTFGKAAGVMGAVVLASKPVVDWLINTSRAFIYTTSMPPFLVEVIQENLVRLAGMDQQRKMVFMLNRALTKELAGFKKWKTGRSTGAIVPIEIAGNENCRRVASTCRENGFDIRAVLSPTVPAGHERIRICLHAYNTMDEISGLARILLTAENDFH